jgi:large subunit ribosomal protein L9
MKIILTQDFETLGFEGDVVDVAKGYARNYLMPKGVGVLANNANLKALEMRKEKIMARRLKDKEAAEKIKEKVSQMTLTFIQKAGGEGKLYGSVTSRDIAEKLEKEGVAIDRRKIVIDEAIRSLGEFEVTIKLHPMVSASLKVIVEGEAQEGEEESDG